jgi:N-acetylglutamate synthase-like GNAT family acetyltransferase
VRNTAAPWYSTEIVDAWAARLTEENVKRVRQETTDSSMIVVVGEVDSVVAGFGMAVPGFGMAVPADAMLRAVYVHPEYGRRGVGTAVLAKLEEVASQQGVAELSLFSSLNAEMFYAKHGYAAIDRTVHRLRSGQEMACVKMAKRLTETRDR